MEFCACKYLKFIPLIYVLKLIFFTSVTKTKKIFFPLWEREVVK